MDSEPPLDGPGEESQLYCKPVAKKPKTTDALGVLRRRGRRGAGRSGASPEPIDVDADDASDGDDLDRFGPRTEVDLRLGVRGRAKAGRLAPEHEAWWNADTKKRLSDLERAVATHPALAVPPKEGAKLPRATVLGDHLEATVSSPRRPRPRLLHSWPTRTPARAATASSPTTATASLVACGRGARRRRASDMSGKPTRVNVLFRFL